MEQLKILTARDKLNNAMMEIPPRAMVVIQTARRLFAETAMLKPANNATPADKPPLVTLTAPQRFAAIV